MSSWRLPFGMLAGRGGPGSRIAAHGSFVYLGTLDAVRQENTAVERSIQELEIFDGRIYPAYGDWQNNGDVRAIVSLDILTGIQAEHLAAAATDYYRMMQGSDGDILVAYTDPDSGTYPGAAKRVSGVWSEPAGSIGITCYHVFDAREWDGDWYLCGAHYIDASNSGAAVWRSTNKGVSWTKVWQGPDTTGANRAYGFAVYDDRLVVMATESSSVAGHYYLEHGETVWENDAVDSRPGATGAQIWKSRNYGSNVYWVSQSYGIITTSSSSGRQSRTQSLLRGPLDRSAGPTTVINSGTVAVWDFAVADSGVYALTEHMEILHSATALAYEDFSVLVTADRVPAQMRSIQVHDGVIYLGDSGGNVWASVEEEDASVYTLNEHFLGTSTPSGWTLTDASTPQISFGQSLFKAVDTSSAGGAWGTPRLIYQTPFTRVAGRTFQMSMPHVGNGGNWHAGFMQNTNGTWAVDYAGVGGSNLVYVIANPGVGAVTAPVLVTAYTHPGMEFRIVLRATGASIFQRGFGLPAPYDDANATGRGDWALIGRERINVQASGLYAGIQLAGHTPSEMLVDYIRVYDGDTHNPTIDDPFTRADSAVSLGGSWTAQVGTWGISSNDAYCTDTDSADKIATIDAGIADGIVESPVANIAASRAGGVVFRFVDTSNYWRAYYDGTNFLVDEVTAGVATNRYTVADAGTSGRICIALIGNKIGVHVGTNGLTYRTTLTSTVHQTATKHGLYVKQNATNIRFSEFQVWGGMVA